MIVDPADYATETVTTYADGFGRWHARVQFPEPGYGPQYLDANIDRIRAKARRAIRREMLAREFVGHDLVVRVEVVACDQDSLNRPLHHLRRAHRRLTGGIHERADAGRCLSHPRRGHAQRRLAQVLIHHSIHA